MYSKDCERGAFVRCRRFALGERHPHSAHAYSLTRQYLNATDLRATKSLLSSIIHSNGSSASWGPELTLSFQLTNPKWKCS